MLSVSKINYFFLVLYTVCEADALAVFLKFYIELEFFYWTYIQK